MKIIRAIHPLAAENKIILAIGNFDGIHLGHQAIFKEMEKEKNKINGQTVILTFEPHPIKFLDPERELLLLTPFHEKMELLEKFGIDTAICVPFTKEFAEMSAEIFIKNILHDSLKANSIFLGEDFNFGKDKKGSYDLLKQNSEKYGFKVNLVKTISLDNITVSSTNIRKFLLLGNVEMANKLLGRPYSIRGKVIHGKGLKFEIPTATLEPHHELTPGQGVYAVRVEFDGKKYPGAANIGLTYPYQTYKPTIEIHIFNFNETIYHEFIKVEFLKFIRGEIIFKSQEELKAQIKKDIEKIKEVQVNE
ncbi:MAG: bifunctional riboflavin kinase/FAD synthetase [bacterium]|nr:bifunctional riboflavin kinase/FAD synthetase [bacterium]